MQRKTSTDNSASAAEIKAFFSGTCVAPDSIATDPNTITSASNEASSDDVKLIDTTEVAANHAEVTLLEEEERVTTPKFRAMARGQSVSETTTTEV